MRDVKSEEERFGHLPGVFDQADDLAAPVEL
jgi:hypothetical protein